MLDKTQLNNELLNVSSSTMINNFLNSNGTILNEELVSIKEIAKGTILCEKYIVEEKLDVSTGEADLYICNYAKEQYIAKIYKRKEAIKSEVAAKLKSINSKCVAKLYDMGEYNGYPLEILPYYKNGSLQGKKFSFEDLKNHIIPCLNEGLFVLHSNGIIHKDLKPSNIMITDNQKNVAIIDFGISSVRNDGNTVIVTKTGMTPEYSAPETFVNAFLPESDYYSLGITVFELYYGFTPYRNMDSDEIIKFLSIQGIPFPENISIPKDLKNFINAVTYKDITNRHDKSNPNRRWVYDEVKNWCEGKNQTIPGESVGNKSETTKAYTFHGKAYTNRTELLEAFNENWNDGKKDLFRGILSQFFKSIDPEMANSCIDAEKEITLKVKKDDLIFFNILYKIDKDTRKFYWKGKVYSDLYELGIDLLEHLHKNDDSLNTYIDDILKEGVLSEYINIINPNNNSILSAIKGLESNHRIFSNNPKDKLLNYYLTAYMLSGKKILYVNGMKFNTIDELTSHIKKLLMQSYEKFEFFCHNLIDSEEKLDPQFEAWLLSLNKQKEIEKWKQTL